MRKLYGTCKLCKSNRLLNFAGLCKRCNKKEESTEIIGKAVEKQKKDLQAKQDMAKQKAAEPEEKPALEEKSEGKDDKEKKDEKGGKGKEAKKDSKK